MTNDFRSRQRFSAPPSTAQRIERVSTLAGRGDANTVAGHCKQVAAVTREGLTVVRTLGQEGLGTDAS